MTSARPRWRALALAGLALVACVPALPGGAARAPNRQVPGSFGVDADAESSARVDWREFFTDPHLVALIDVALANNQELNLTVQEMLVAGNEVMARRGEYMPTLGVSGGAGVDRVGHYTSQGQSDERNGVDANLQSYSFGLFASWEVDIWGRLRNAAEAARYRYLASREGRNFMVTRLVAEIASHYYELMALDRQLEIVRNNVRLQQDSLEMVRLRQQAARVTMLAVRRFEAQLQGFQSRQYEIAQRIVETENQLNLLLGRFPAPIPRSTETFLTLEPAVHAGLPAQILENRPDVRRAELELRAASLDVSAARARFYPALHLDGRLGYQSFDVRHLVDTPDSILYGIFAGLAAPLLNRAGITAEYFSANSRQMQAVLRYERAILTAFLEVNTGLNLVRNLTLSYALKSQQVDRLTESVEISTLLFNSARADYLEVLTTRRDSLEAQMELIETKQRQLTATVTLYQALGGGWRRLEGGARAAQGANAGIVAATDAGAVAAIGAATDA
ncbi:MAG: efflux system, outer rane lipoprotein NodT family, partial [Myxococcaceae bacterium]|nr:efflux system, outer rane lipoprotein NodT family [Myxococcaceae bacterium]